MPGVPLSFKQMMVDGSFSALHISVAIEWNPIMTLVPHQQKDCLQYISMSRCTWTGYFKPLKKIEMK